MRIMFPKRSPSKIAKPKSERQTEDRRKPKTATAKTIIPQKKNRLLFSSFRFLCQKSALSFGEKGSGCISVFAEFIRGENLLASAVYGILGQGIFALIVLLWILGIGAGAGLIIDRGIFFIKNRGRKQK